MNKSIDLPNLSTFTTGDDSFYKTTNLTLSSIFIHFNSSLETPFNKGQYTHGERAFSKLQKNSIEWDLGLLFLFLLIFRVREFKNKNY